MFSVVLVVHLLIAMCMIGLILVQQSEGGGLGSSGGGMGSFMTPRGTANLLTRATAILAGCFMLTSLALVVMSGTASQHLSVIDQLEEHPGDPAAGAPEVPTPAPADANAPSVPVGK